MRLKKNGIPVLYSVHVYYNNIITDRFYSCTQGDSVFSLFSSYVKPHCQPPLLFGFSNTAAVGRAPFDNRTVKRRNVTRAREFYKKLFDFVHTLEHFIQSFGLRRTSPLNRPSDRRSKNRSILVSELNRPSFN